MIIHYILNWNQISLGISINMYILLKKSDSRTEFTLHLDFDQSFIPKLLNFIHEISQVKPCVESIDSTILTFATSISFKKKSLSSMIISI